MDVKFKLKGFEAKVKGEASVKADELELVYENFNIAEIPAIIKETRKVIREIADIEREVAESLNPFVHFGGNSEEDADDIEELDDVIAELDDEDDEDEIDEETTENVDEEKLSRRDRPKRATTGRRNKPVDGDDDLKFED